MGCMVQVPTNGSRSGVMSGYGRVSLCWHGFLWCCNVCICLYSSYYIQYTHKYEWCISWKYQIRLAKLQWWEVQIPFWSGKNGDTVNDHQIIGTHVFSTMFLSKKTRQIHNVHVLWPATSGSSPKVKFSSCRKEPELQWIRGIQII